MKKLLSLLMAMLMTMTFCTAALADDGETFEPILLGMVEESGAYWNSGDVMRATFVASLLTDLVLAGKEDHSSALIDGVIAQGAGYFCYSEADGMIIVYAFGENQTQLIVYTPSSNLCTVGFTDTTVPVDLAPKFIASLEEQGYTYYPVDGLAVYQYFEEIVAIITGE